MKLSSVTTELINFFENNKSHLPNGMQKAFLFGCFARGDARVGSDADVALVAKDTWKIEQRNIARDWLEGFDAHLSVSPFFTTENKLLRTTDKFDANYWIAREGILLWEK